MDNALDARAKSLHIDVAEANLRGKKVKYIFLQDDGCGMTPSELHSMMSFGITGEKV